LVEEALVLDQGFWLGLATGRGSSSAMSRFRLSLAEGGESEASRRELFPRMGFIVTNLALPSRAVVCFYNKRRTSEQRIKEGKQAVKMTRLSCHRFRSNEVRLWLSVIAYNLGNLWRRLVLPKRIDK
jgi:hypothetical protein